MYNHIIDFVKRNSTWIIGAFIILSIAAVYWHGEQSRIHLFR